MVRVFLFSAIVVALIATSIPIVGDDTASEEKLWDLYEMWQSRHGVSCNVDEKRTCFDIFKENAKYVFASNKKPKPYKLSLNKFSDMTREELKRTYAGTRIRRRITLIGSTSLEGCFLYKNVTNVTPTERSPAVVIDGYEDVPVNDEDALLRAVANQPVSLAIEASGQDFQFSSEVCTTLCWGRRSKETIKQNTTIQLTKTLSIKKMT
ncbi:hypothetical protein BHM03_00041586 [Ensete ventricosum]|nr:hypothetical protein BHM03_00041586 [Ensete ventricosum]